MKYMVYTGDVDPTYDIRTSIDKMKQTYDAITVNVCVKYVSYHYVISGK